MAFECDQYPELAKSTLSPNFYGPNVLLEELTETLNEIMRAGQLADTLKRELFYGVTPRKTMPADEFQASVYNVITKAEQVNHIHAVLGMASEMKELAENLIKFIHHREVDKTNLKEEIGDVGWYQALLLTTFGMELSEVQKSNLTKLKVRYPDGFGEEEAVERDLDAEDEALSQ